MNTLPTLGDRPDYLDKYCQKVRLDGEQLILTPHMFKYQRVH